MMMPDKEVLFFKIPIQKSQNSWPNYSWLDSAKKQPILAVAECYETLAAVHRSSTDGCCYAEIQVSTLLFLSWSLGKHQLGHF